MESQQTPRTRRSRKVQSAHVQLPSSPKPRRRARSRKKCSGSLAQIACKRENLPQANSRGYINSAAQARSLDKSKLTLVIRGKPEGEYPDEFDNLSSRPQTPWQKFEDHVRIVSMVSRPQEFTPHAVSVKSSDIFQKVIHDLKYKTPITYRKQSVDVLSC